MTAITNDSMLLWIDTVACTVIWVRLMLYQRNGAKHSWSYSFFAYLIILATGSVTIRAITGHYPNHDPSGTLLNVVLAIAFLRSKGNVAKILKE